MNQVLDNLFEVINEFLQCAEVVALFATSKSVRMLLILQDNVVRRRRKTSLSFATVEYSKRKTLSTAASATAQAQRSGRSVIALPMSIPPALPPSQAK